MREALSLATWADHHARRERRARVALLVAAVVTVLAWSQLSTLVERAYWDAAEVDRHHVYWRLDGTLTAVSVRLLASFTLVSVVLTLLARRVAGARAATAVWVSLGLLGSVCVAPCFADVIFDSPVEYLRGRTCVGPASGWFYWWVERLRGLGWYENRWLARFQRLLSSDELREVARWLLLASPGLLIVPAFLKLTRRLGPRFGSCVAVASRAAIALSVLALLVSGWALLTRPRPADYVSTLPVLATLPSEQEVARSPRRGPAPPMAIIDDQGRLYDGSPLDERWTSLERHVGAVAFRYSCRRSLGDEHTYCDLNWRSATWRHWLPVTARFSDDPTREHRVELRLDRRARVAFLTLGPRVVAGLYLDRLPTEAERRVEHPERWFVPPPRAHLAMVRLPVAPYLSTVGLALAGLLATLLLRALDRRLPSRDALPRGYRDDARDATALLPYDLARIEAWRRDDALEPAWRTLAVLALTHAPLAAWFLARALA
ncbi:MAG: hypothetical protein R3A52_31155 [Polyangiales bacterium]